MGSRMPRKHHSVEDGEIDIIFTGLRPGEKLTEELYDAEEISPYAGYEKLLVLTRQPRSDVVAYG